MKILSLFDGVSCARLALEKAGIPVEAYYASEIDKYAIKVTQANRPDTVHLGDVRSVGIFADNNWKTFYLKGDIDLLIGGSPCQDLSIAGKNRKGLDGERSGLFWEYVRILNEIKPKYFVLENVASMSKEAKQVITDALGVEPIMINAALVSAQNRKRLFWTNIPGIIQPEDRGVYLKDILETEVDEKYLVTEDCSLTPSSNPAIVGTLDEGTWSKRFEQIRRVYSIDSKSPTIPTGTGGGVMTKIAVEKKSYCVPATYYKENVKSLEKRKKIGLTVRVGQIGNGGQGDRIYSQDGKSVALSAMGGGRGAKTGLYEVDTVIRKLTPIETERLQSMPDNWTNPTGDISNTQRYKMCGNAFNVDVVAHILSFIK